MKILLVNSHQIGGVEYYRMMAPCHYLSLQDKGFEFVSCNTLKGDTYHITEEYVYNPETKETEFKQYPEDNYRVPMDEWVKRFDLVHFCRAIDVYGDTEITDRLKRLGIPFGLDLDDYWHLPPSHILYKDYLQNKKPEAIIQAIKDANFVTCTTPILAKAISLYNKNVHILPNAIDHELSAWQPDYSTKQRMRFGFYQGTTHEAGFKLIAKSIHKVMYHAKLKDKAQIVLAGFDAKFKEPSMSVRYERLITNDLDILKGDELYQAYLMMCIKDHNEDYVNHPYFRVWHTDVAIFPYTYHFCDVSLITLIQDKFNSCKSELKLIEAGMKGKGAIVSNVEPYTLLANRKNSYLCNSGNDFFDKIKRAIENPVEVADKAEQLREDVLKRHTLKVVTPKRKQLYLQYK